LSILHQGSAPSDATSVTSGSQLRPGGEGKGEGRGRGKGGRGERGEREGETEVNQCLYVTADRYCTEKLIVLFCKNFLFNPVLTVIAESPPPTIKHTKIHCGPLSDTFPPLPIKNKIYSFVSVSWSMSAWKDGWSPESFLRQTWPHWRCRTC
jgi:hypothetical protein